VKFSTGKGGGGGGGVFREKVYRVSRGWEVKNGGKGGGELIIEKKKN